jgi:hypothetical protein
MGALQGTGSQSAASLTVDAAAVAALLLWWYMAVSEPCTA